MEIVALLLGALLGAAPQENAGADCRDIVAFQVLLDRSGFSPGEIDGRAGANTTRALSAFQEAKGLPLTGTTDCATRKALGGQPILADYTITPDDGAGPFTESIPNDLVAQAQLPALAYQSLLERLGERFHAAPALIQRVEPWRTIRRGANHQGPGGRAVRRHGEAGDPAESGWSAGPRRSLARGIAEGVSRRRIARDVRAGYDRQRARSAADRSVEGLVSIGCRRSATTPTSSGTPIRPQKARIKPGPNNPVGRVWIDIDKEHYGIHGTPEPSKSGRRSRTAACASPIGTRRGLAALVRSVTPVISERSEGTPLAAWHSRVHRLLPRWVAAGCGFARRSQWQHGPKRPSPQPAVTINESTGEPAMTASPGAPRAVEPGSRSETTAPIRSPSFVGTTAAAGRHDDHVDVDVDDEGPLRQRRGGGSRGHEAIDILAPRARRSSRSRTARSRGSSTASLAGSPSTSSIPTEQFCYYYAHLSGTRQACAKASASRRAKSSATSAPPATRRPARRTCISRFFSSTDAKRWWEGRPIDPYLVFKD